MIGPCNAEGCDCGHTIETLRRQKAELREALEKLLYAADNSNTCSMTCDNARAALANTKETP